MANLTHVRPVRSEDLDALVTLAGLTGGGMTNLPNDREALAAKIARSLASLAKSIDRPDDEYYMLVLVDGASGAVVGTASLYSRLGAVLPFYSYKLMRVTHASQSLSRIVSTDVLHLCNDFDGASEVGGLFLHPDARSGGNGALLARSRYLFIDAHRERFGDRVVVELRGTVADGVSPFWEAVARPFFGADFQAADHHNALHGNQFIADLMPRYPIYVSMLPQAAQDAIGRVHPASAPALRMLEAEGFTYDGYVDIFDAGPTLSITTDRIRTIVEHRPGAAVTPEGTRQRLHHEGRLERFVCHYA